MADRHFKDPSLVLEIYGDCLVCTKALDESVDTVVLVEKHGAFVRFGDDGELATPDVSLNWAHGAHMN